MSQIKKSAHMSEAQKKLLIEFMESEDELRSGKFSNSFTYKDAQRKWNDVCTKLNSIPGAKKDWVMWRRTWQDLKKNVKKKNTDRKRYTQGTGGGPSMPEEKIFTEDDLHILDILDKTAVDGNVEVEESTIFFDHDYLELDIDQTDQSQASDEKGMQSINTEDGVRGEEKKNSHGVSRQKKRKMSVNRLSESLKTSQTISNILEKKVQNKENYFTEKLRLMRCEIDFRQAYLAEKLELLKRDIQVKEQIATSLEYLTSSNANDELK